MRRYDYDGHYHQVSDEANTLDYEAMATVVKYIVLASECIVNGSKTPTRIDTGNIPQ
ncbi:MAG: hypothetical protein ABIX01_02210 [Chitinophagaceae bacterium]